MQIRFDEQTVLITGAGGGIGRGYAKLLASRGARVVVNDIATSDGSSSPAASVVEEIVTAGGRAVLDTHDVSTHEGGLAMIDHAVDHFGSLEAVIHNAGTLRDRTIAKMSQEDIEDVMAVHLLGGFNVVLPAFAVMRESRYGRILLTTSGSGLAGTFGQANYGAAKAGLVGLMHVAAIEGQRHGILVNAIAPGARTQMTKNLLGDLEDRLDPELVAPMAAYLVSRESTTTHEIFSAAGGRFARYFIGTTQGWYQDADGPASIEAIQDHLDEIRSLDEFRVLDEGGQEGEMLREAFARTAR